MLLLSLFVLASLLLGATALSAIVIRDLRGAAVGDAGHAAYYAAETGIEQALYAVRKAGVEPATLSGGETLATGPSFVRQVNAGEPVLYVPSLAKDDFTELDLYDPTDLSVPSGIKALTFGWNDACGGNSSLELSYVQWPTGSSITWPPGAGYGGTYWKYPHRRSDGVPWVFTAVDGANNDYRMQVKALDCDVTDLQIRGWSDAGATIPKDLPSRVTISSTGSAGGAEQKLSVSMQRSAPLSGIFGFVIFSEADIVK